MRFEFGCAKKLYERNVHPRVLLGPKDVERLRERVRCGNARKLMNAVRKCTRPCAEEILTCDDILGGEASTKRYERFGAMILDRALDVAIVGVLDEDERCLEAARRIIHLMPDVVERSDYDILVHGRITPTVHAFDLVHGRLTAEERAAFTDWMLATQVRAIIADRWGGYYRSAGRNLVFGKTLSATHAVLALRGEPGVGSLDDEIAELISFLEATINTAVSCDGYPEEDMGYGTDFHALIWSASDALRRAGLFDAPAACPRLVKTGRALLHFMQPWGRNLSATGDAGDHITMRERVLPRLAAEADDPAVLWMFGTLRQPNREEVAFGRDFHVPANAFSLILLDQINKPVHPSRTKPPTQFRDRGRGIVSLRSGWRADDTLVVFDGSQRCPAAQGHEHASCGHFSISALGEYFAIDTGRYHMEQDEHNVVLVDGVSGRSTNHDWRMMFHHGRLIDYAPGPFVDYAVADSSAQHDAYWARRHLGLVKGPGAPAYVWTVEDVNKDNAGHEFWWTLNTSPANTVRTARTHATVYGSRHGNMLDVSFALLAPDEYPEPHTLTVTQDIKTCNSTNYLDPVARAAEYDNPEDMVHYAAFRRPRLIAKVAGLNGRFMSIMIPRRKGRTRAAVKRLKSLPCSLAVRITFDRVEDTLIFAYEHGMLEAGDVEARGAWCVVRRSRKTGRVLAHELGYGRRLSVGGRALEVTSNE